MRQLPALVLLLLVASCSGKKAGPPAPAYADRTSFCHQWAVLSCNDNVISKCLATSADTCIAAAETDCESKIPDGKYSSVTAETCLDAVKTAYSDDKITATERDVLVSLGGACSKIISGSGASGDACGDDTDCNRDSDLACIKKTGATAGKCGVPNPVDNGADCSGTDAVCGDGFYCDGKHCVEGGKQDDPCSAAEPCTTDLRCVEPSATPATGDGGAGDGGTVTSTTATCQPFKQRGDVCETDGECQSRICVVVSKNLSKCADEIPIAPGSKICASIQ